MANSERYDGDLIGVDVGGTFTVLVIRSGERCGALARSPAPGQSGFRGDECVAGKRLSRVALVIPATTTTNAVLERKLSRTGLITTAGFRDVLELGRRKAAAYGMKAISTRSFRATFGSKCRKNGLRRRVDPARRGGGTAGEELLAHGAESVVIRSFTPMRTRRTRSGPPRSSPTSGRTATSRWGTGCSRSANSSAG